MPSIYRSTAMPVVGPNGELPVAIRQRLRGHDDFELLAWVTQTGIDLAEARAQLLADRAELDGYRARMGAVRASRAS